MPIASASSFRRWSTVFSFSKPVTTLLHSDRSSRLHTRHRQPRTAELVRITAGLHLFHCICITESGWKTSSAGNVTHNMSNGWTCFQLKSWLPTKKGTLQLKPAVFLGFSTAEERVRWAPCDNRKRPSTADGSSAATRSFRRDVALAASRGFWSGE